MRRILIENARRKKQVRHGAGCQCEELHDVVRSGGPDPETLLTVDEAVTRLAETDPAAADVVNLHFFVGMTLDETAAALGVSRNSLSSLGLRSRIAAAGSARLQSRSLGVKNFGSSVRPFRRFLSH